MSGYFLLDNRNPNGDHFYRARRNRVLAIVVHVTAGLEDFDTVNDQSAEKTARYAATTDRAVSWHSGSDTDSAFDLLPASYTAFQCKGYNSSTFGHEISKRTADWRRVPPAWVDRTLHHAGRHLGPKARELGVPLRRATKAELDRALANNGAPVGFIGHHQLDPSRRSDPGLVGGTDTFPWARFFDACRGAASPPPPLPPKVRPMFDPPQQLARIVDAMADPVGGGVWLLGEDGGIYTYCGARFLGSAVGKPWWGDRKAARLHPNGRPDRGYQIEAQTSERYSDF